jgi:hypothetical protein
MFQRAALMPAAMLIGVLLSVQPALAAPGPILPPAPGAGVVASPAQVSFGSIDTHFGGSPQQSISFSNESQSPVTVISTSLAGAEAASFQLVSDGCSGQELGPSGSCAVEVRFPEGAQGEKNATLTLLDSEGIVEVPLSGTGVTGTLSATPDPLSFAAIPYARPNHGEGNESETEQITVADSQDAGARIESVSISGVDASSFSIQYGNCELNLLAPNNSCDTGVGFQPTSPGPKHAQLVIKSDAADSPLVVPLQGEGLNGPQISLSSSQALLGEIALGASTEQTFTVTNSGDYPLFIQQSFVISGTPLMFPLQSDSCTGQVLKPSVSCAFTIGFQPTATGEKDASIVFVTNASPAINVIGINGIGVQPVANLPAIVAGPAITQTLSPPAPATPKPAAPPTLLTFERASRLYSVLGQETVDAGVRERCPAGTAGCRAESFITACIPAHHSSTPSVSSAQTLTLLGSQTIRLRGGESTSGRIPLSATAATLLRERRHVRATIFLVVRAAGAIIAERTRTVTLVAPS